MILREKPDVVVVELDSERFFHGLAVMEHVGIFEERHGQHEADNVGSSTLGALELFSKVPFTSDGPFNLLMLLDFHATRIKLAIAGGGPGTDGEEFLRQSERRSKSAPTSTWATATIKSPKAGA